MRLVWAASMFLLVLAPTSLVKHVAVGWVLLLMSLLFLIYFAGADALYLARLGAYAALAEIDAEPDARSGTPIGWLAEPLARRVEMVPRISPS